MRPIFTDPNYTKVPVAYRADKSEIGIWCNDNVGVNNWDFADNSFHYIFVIPSKLVMWFKLRWC